MSETITLGKSRKDGKWSVLVQPERPFGEHLDAYRKIASRHPVSDDFTKVVIGKLHHSSPALLLVSAEEASAKKQVEVARQQSVKEIVETANARQEAITKEVAETKAAEHAEVLAEKNEMINRVRRDTNQPLNTKPPVRKLEIE